MDLDPALLETIKCNNPNSVEDQAFEMLCKWLQRNVQSCYCKLICAMEEEHLSPGVQKLKEKIKSSKVYLTIASYSYSIEITINVGVSRPH